MTDYIIIGAGSAGCVMANRLSENNKVTLIEAGRRDHRWDFRVHMPAALSMVLASRMYNWHYQSEPEPYLDNRSMYCPRGKVLGGSSSINGMIFVRGNRGDYDRWASEHGLASWSYEHCLPYFKKSETAVSTDATYRGQSGPLRLGRGELKSPLFDAWLEAGQQLGFPLTWDFNGESQEGVGPFDQSIYKGVRQNTSRAYLDPVRGRENLEIISSAHVARLLFADGRAVGVEYLKDGKIERAYASAEVILSGGAINSPQLLMLSGIGDADALSEHGIDVVQHLPGVGQNLQDHLEIYVQYAATKPVSVYPATQWYRQPFVGLEWYLAKSGAGATNHFETGGFLKSSDDKPFPDLQYHFLPIAMDYDGKDQYRGHGFQAHVGPMKPVSRGHVKLRSANPFQSPEILFNYNQAEEDRAVMRRGIRLARELIAQEAFAPYRGRELRPGEDAQSDDDIDAFIRRYSESAYHPSCTCKMGHDDMAVVDEQGRVHGVDGLRVVDVSIMPEITNGNLNAPAIMMAEKIADTIVA